MKTRVLAGLIVVWLSTPAFAVECAAPEGTTSSGTASQSVEARVAFLAQVLGEEAAATGTWKLLWGAGYGLITLGQLALMSLSTAGDRPDWVIGAASSAIGLASVLMGPLEVTEQGAHFVERAKVVTPEQTCQLLLDGERMLGAGAATEAFGTSWIAHLGNVLFNVGVGLGLGLGLGHWRTAGINTGVGIVIGGATALTRPTGLVRGWERYRRGPKAEPAVHVQLVPSGLGVGVLMTF